MQFDLVSGSEHATHALYDPAVAGRLPAIDTEPGWDAWVDHQVTAGRMFYYYRAGDEELQLKLYVDEPFEPAEEFTKVDELDGSILRVESGKLVLSDITVFYAAEGDYGAPAQVEVPPGIYRLRALHGDYRFSPARIEADLAPQLEPGDAGYAKRVDRFAMPLGCFMMLAGVLSAVAFLFAAANWSWRLVAAAVALVVGAGAAVGVWRLLASPRMTRWQRAKDEMWKRYPRTVVELWRLADDEVPTTFPPARLG